MVTTTATGSEPIPDCVHEDGAVELSIVMPCLNEALTVGRCVDKAVAALGALGVRGEVIVADNGSTDGSIEIAQAHGARVVFAIRRGYGSALQSGIASAAGRYVIIGDADDSYDFGRLEQFVERLRAGDELVMGNRFRGGIEPGAMPWLHRYIGNPLLTGILNLFFHTPIRDAHCGLRGFRKEAYLRWGVRSPGMEFASEMVIKASLQRNKISEVPTVLYPDGRDRPPHLRSFRDGWRHLRLLLMLCPRWLYLTPAALLLGSGLGLMSWLAWGTQPAGSLALEVLIMFLGALLVVLGYQTLWLWAFAETFGSVSRVLPPDTFLQRVLRHVSLDRGLLAGATLVALGLVLNGWLVWELVGHRLAPLDTSISLRHALCGLTTIVLGIQTVYGGFFLGMLRMSADDEVPRR